ncbi:MAG: glutathione peroxidase [Candidatus Parvibacillus calidus]|nr:MAG: glutathione peroxidase [Candidatus Parvibacillus calidus]
MTRPFFISLILTLSGIIFLFSSTKNDTGAHQSIYDFNATTLDGAPFHFADLKGKTILVVNTASNCGFTPQFESLEALYRKYADRGLVIVGFPCNQFGGQEPGGKEETEKICFAKYDVTFPMMEKTDVNGRNAHPLFVFLKDRLPGFPGKKIKWNFTKFLINAEGKPIKRFAPWDKPEKIDHYLENHIWKK